MELLCLTGVEDQLQTDVRPTLEILRNAGIKVWAADGLMHAAIKQMQLKTNTDVDVVDVDWQRNWYFPF